MKVLEPDMIIRFPKKPDCVGGKIVAEVARPRKFLGFRWMSKFRKEYITINHLRYYETHN